MIEQHTVHVIRNTDTPDSDPDRFWNIACNEFLDFGHCTLFANKGETVEFIAGDLNKIQKGVNWEIKEVTFIINDAK